MLGSRLWGGGQLRILQWNCNGVRPKLDQLRAFLEAEKIDCAFIQETHLNKHHRLDLGHGYTIRRMDRPSHKGGVMSIFNTRLHRVYRMRIQPPAGVEGQSWILYMPNNDVLIVHNWYNHGRSSNKSFSLNSVKPYMRTGALLLGDFNCKSPWWGYAGTDHVGRTVQAFVEANDVAFLNDKDAKTLKSFNTTPDLSIASKDLASLCTWRLAEPLGSDHKTIVISLSLASRSSFLLPSLWDPAAKRVTPLPPAVRLRRQKIRTPLSLLYTLVGQLAGNVCSWAKAAAKLLEVKKTKKKRTTLKRLS